MKFRIYTEGGDDQVFVISGQINSRETNKFVFTGFANTLHPYYKKQIEWFKKILSSAGVYLNLRLVSTVHEIGDPDRGCYEPGDIQIPDDADVSKDENIYFLIMDEEMGRGWAVLIKQVADGEQVIITQEHRDTVIDELLDGEFIRSFGIDYQYETVTSLLEIPTNN